MFPSYRRSWYATRYHIHEMRRYPELTISLTNLYREYESNRLSYLLYVACLNEIHAEHIDDLEREEYYRNA